MDDNTQPTLVAPPPTGIYDMTADEYFGTDAISQSFLWKVYTTTPAHAFYGERKETNALDMGHAIHTAVLEPEDFERRVLRGPEDRRGNKWKDAQAEAEAGGKLLLTSGDFDKALAVRDAVHADQFLNQLVTGGAPQVEKSAFWTDPDTGLVCRSRNDLWRPDLGVILDLKTATCAAAWDYAKAIATYGHHVQENHYREGWAAAGGGDVQGFVFLVVEKAPPYAHALYELEAAAVEEGRLIRQKTMQSVALCRETGIWPAYPTGVQPLGLPRWAHKELAADMLAAE